MNLANQAFPRTALRVLIAISALLAGGFALYHVGGAPAAHAAGLYIYTDQPNYAPGATVKACYTVPAPGPISVVETTSTGTSTTILQGVDDGTGGCLFVAAGATPGSACLTINYQSSTGVVSAAQTCFTVGVVQPSPSPSTTPSPTPTPTPTPSPKPSPSPSPSTGPIAIVGPINVVFDFPLVNSVSRQSLTPGDSVELDGQNFGAKTGQVQLTGNFPGGAVTLQVTSWAAGKVVATVPDISGALDQQAQLQLSTATGAEANAMDVHFTAKRQTVNLDGSVLQMHCPNSTQFDYCLAWSGGATATASGSHESDCCFNGVDGTDEYTATLGNGWQVQSVHIERDSDEESYLQYHCIADLLGVTADDYGYSALASASPAGSAFVDVKVNWHVNANCSPTAYKLTIAITGPAGVAYSPNQAPGVTIAPPTGHR